MFQTTFLANDYNKSEAQKKNAEHTHMHTIFRDFLTQYSRWLLSILAHLTKKNKKTSHCGVKTLQ